MKTRRLGRTGHFSSIAIFGGAALGRVTQAVADEAIALAIRYGINHIDIAPSYGSAEERVGPWLARQRERFFVGCKTTERTRDGAGAELRRSLQRLQTDRFDLYQIHAVTSMDELDEAMRSGGAIEALTQARDEGLTQFLGITGHGAQTPRIFLEALRRFPFDTVLFPLNFIQCANTDYREAADELIAMCHDRDVGTMIIKSITKRPWGDREPTHATWYEPFTDPDLIQQAVDYALSHDVTGICTAGDTRVLPHVLKACEQFQPMGEEQKASLRAKASQYEPLFV